MTRERKNELRNYFWAETNDPETSEWRDSLTAEEKKIVNRLDTQYNKGFYNLLKALDSAIKKNEAKRHADT